ncbi:MAG: ABC transporter permease [Gemmatimonadaceae bacterium]
MSRVDTGFAADHLLIFDVEPRPGVRTSEPIGDVGQRVREALANTGGVVSASWGSATPLGLDASRRGMTVDGYRAAPGEEMEHYFNVVGPNFFETMKIPIVRGRSFTAADRKGASRVAIVRGAFARRCWPGGEALGKRLTDRRGEGEMAEVVGVARDARFMSLCWEV